MFTCFSCYVCIIMPVYCILNTGFIINQVTVSCLISIRINKVLTFKLCIEKHCTSELLGCYSEAAVTHISLFRNPVYRMHAKSLFPSHILGCWHKSWCSAFLRRNRFCQGWVVWSWAGWTLGKERWGCGWSQVLWSILTFTIYPKK